LTKNQICSAGLKDYFEGTDNIDFITQKPDKKMVKLCRKFIREMMSPSKSAINSSYHLKHEVERWSGVYITNGAFILAALLEGINQVPTSIHSPNTHIFAKKNYKYIEPDKYFQARTA